MNIDERLEAITMNLGLMSAMVKDLIDASQRNEAAIERLTAIVAPIAQLVLDHERRIGRLESGQK